MFFFLLWWPVTGVCGEPWSQMFIVDTAPRERLVIGISKVIEQVYKVTSLDYKVCVLPILNIYFPSVHVLTMGTSISLIKVQYNIFVLSQSWHADNRHIVSIKSLVPAILARSTLMKSICLLYILQTCIAYGIC